MSSFVIHRYRIHGILFGLWIFEYGEFENEGIGSYENWTFGGYKGGNFTRHGDPVKLFRKAYCPFSRHEGQGRVVRFHKIKKWNEMGWFTLYYYGYGDPTDLFTFVKLLYVFLNYNKKHFQKGCIFTSFSTNVFINRTLPNWNFWTLKHVPLKGHSNWELGEIMDRGIEITIRDSPYKGSMEVNRCWQIRPKSRKGPGNKLNLYSLRQCLFPFFLSPSSVKYYK